MGTTPNSWTGIFRPLAVVAARATPRIARPEVPVVCLMLPVFTSFTTRFLMIAAVLVNVRVMLKLCETTGCLNFCWPTAGLLSGERNVGAECPHTRLADLARPPAFPLGRYDFARPLGAFAGTQVQKL